MAPVESAPIMSASVERLLCIPRRKLTRSIVAKTSAARSSAAPQVPIVIRVSFRRIETFLASTCRRAKSPNWRCCKPAPNAGSRQGVEWGLNGGSYRPDQPLAGREPERGVGPPTRTPRSQTCPLKPRGGAHRPARCHRMWNGDAHAASALGDCVPHESLRGPPAAHR